MKSPVSSTLHVFSLVALALTERSVESALAVGETATLLAPPSSPILKRLLMREGGAAQRQSRRRQGSIASTLKTCGHRSLCFHHCDAEAK